MRLRSSKGDGTSRSDGAPRSDDPRSDGRPRDVAEDERADPVAELVEVMAQQGFEPTVKENGATVVVDLGHCPFATTALADPDTVCSIHLGMAEGITEWAGGLVVDELIPHDPRQGHCRLRVHRTTATSR
jgi:predicted ArsR family transcriptional regulator